MASSKKTKDAKKDKPGKDKKNTSLRLDAKTLKALKLKAINEDRSLQQIMEALVQGYLNGDFKIDQ